MIKDADVTNDQAFTNTSKRKTARNGDQPFHNAVHKHRSRKGIASIEANQYALAHIRCATGNSVTFLDRNKTKSVHVEPPKGEDDSDRV